VRVRLRARKRASKSCREQDLAPANIEHHQDRPPPPLLTAQARGYDESKAIRIAIAKAKEWAQNGDGRKY